MVSFFYEFLCNVTIENCKVFRLLWRILIVYQILRENIYLEFCANSNVASRYLIFQEKNLDFISDIWILKLLKFKDVFQENHYLFYLLYLCLVLYMYKHSNGILKKKTKSLQKANS